MEFARPSDLTAEEAENWSEFARGQAARAPRPTFPLGAAAEALLSAVYLTDRLTDRGIAAGVEQSVMDELVGIVAEVTAKRQLAGNLDPWPVAMAALAIPTELLKTPPARDSRWLEIGVRTRISGQWSARP